MHLLGYDIGSSSVKASIIDSQSGVCLASDFFPKQEAEIISRKAGWAEQDPDLVGFPEEGDSLGSRFKPGR